jgi:predicted MPP superfamily phosphohydrolase
MRRRTLPGPRPVETSARPRRFFKPATGWFRSLERKANQILSLHLHPLIPGAHRPYGHQLDRWLTVSSASVAVDRLPRELDGLGILLLTDLHIGPFLGPEALGRCFDRLLSLEPDLILIGGDVATGTVSEFPPFEAMFRRLQAPLGLFAVLGNHDHYTREPDKVRELVERAGANVLHNRSTLVERDGGRMILAGVDDLNAGDLDLDAALRDAAALQPPEGRLPVVLLSHNPDVFLQAAGNGVSLVLSGHTHGGQIRIPGLPVLVRQSRYRLDEGRFVAQGTELIVSRGLGVTGLPFRIACPPEAIFVRLTTR